MRNKTSAGSRPRPKTIHVDSGGVGSGVDMQEGILSPSRSKKGSTSNLTGNKNTYFHNLEYLVPNKPILILDHMEKGSTNVWITQK